LDETTTCKPNSPHASPTLLWRTGTMLNGRKLQLVLKSLKWLVFAH
jgi:hypothetical protein